MELTVTGEVWEWRGPAPYHFVTVAGDDADDIKDIADKVSYGWGMIPVKATIGRTTWTTSLWPKDGQYVIPLKDAVRRSERVELGDEVTVRMTVTRRS